MKCVIGGGIAGLIWAFYHPDVHVFSILEEHNEILPKYLYDTHENENFFEELMGFSHPSPKRWVEMGILWEGKFLKTTSKHFKTARGQYAMKTRRFVGEAPDYVMSSGIDTFRVIDISFKDLIYSLEILLRKEQRIYYEKVTEIDLKEKRFWTDCWDKGSYSYDELVVSIPLPIFLEISGRKEMISEWDLDWNSEWLLTVGISDPEFWSNKFDFIVYPEAHIPFYRITKGMEKKDLIGVETMVRFNPKEWFQLCDPLFIKKIEHAKIIPPFLLQPNLIDQFKKDGVSFFGRFSQWDPSIKIQDLVKAAKEDAKREM